MANFIRDLVKHLNNANIELIVFFNGAIEPQRMDEWIANQKEDYVKTQQVRIRLHDVFGDQLLRIRSWQKCALTEVVL